VLARAGALCFPGAAPSSLPESQRHAPRHGAPGSWSRFPTAVIDPDRIRVTEITGRHERGANGLYWFLVLFETRSGRCFITVGEAQHLRELDADWVKRALLNLAITRGRGCLEDALVSQSGLMLHHSDAYEPLAAPPDQNPWSTVGVDETSGGRFG
jgi:hypothetical protein